MSHRQHLPPAHHCINKVIQKFTTHIFETFILIKCSQMLGSKLEGAAK